MLNTTSTRNTYTGSGSTNEYDYDYKIFDRTHLLVTVTDLNDDEQTLALDTDYDVTGVGDSDGGSITLTDAGQAWLDGSGFLATSYQLLIRRVMPVKQETDLRNQGDYYPEVHEDEFDKTVMIAQQIKDTTDRSISTRETETGADLTLPSATERAGKFLYFDADGDVAVSSDVIDSTAVPVSTFGETLVAAATAGAARILLGFVGAGATVSTALIEALAVTTAKIAANAITTAKLDLGLFLGLTTVTAVPTDYVAISDTSDSGNNKKALVSDFKNDYYRSVVSTDSVLMTDTFNKLSGNAFTSTLPTAVGCAGKIFRFKNCGASSFTKYYTIATTSAQTIDGASTYVLWQNNDMVTVESDGANWLVVSKFITPLSAVITDEKTNGTTGGTYTSGSFQTRTLQTTYGDTSFYSLSANVITLQPGKYELSAISEFSIRGNDQKLRFRNTSDSTTIAESVNEWSDSVNSDGSVLNTLFGVFTLTASKTFELQSRVQTTCSSSQASSLGDYETYAQVAIKRIGDG